MAHGGKMVVSGGVQHRVIVPPTLEGIRDPSSTDDVVRWAEQAGRIIRPLGGHADDLLSSRVLRFLHDAQANRTLLGSTRTWRARNFEHVWRGLRRIMLAEALGIPTMFGALYVRVLDANGLELMERSLASLRVVTNTGVADIVNGFRNTFELETYNYHGLGTGTNAEAVSDSNLQTGLTTQLNPDNVRATGTQSAPSANVYQSVGTNTVDGTVAITEHGLFSSATVGAGNLWDRSMFGAINLTSGNQLETTYQGTFPAGS